jgi:hypothetical protein
MLALTLAVTTPAIAEPRPIPGYPDLEITDKGHLIYQRDVILGGCGSTHSFNFPSNSLNEQAARACEKAEHMAPLADTGGPPIILVPLALLVAGALLFHKSTTP